MTMNVVIRIRAKLLRMSEKYLEEKNCDISAVVCTQHALAQASSAIANAM